MISFISLLQPASDAGKISREDLAEALLMCMTASAGFGKYCVPLAVEKLDSDLTVAKLDSLKLLVSSVAKPVYIYAYNQVVAPVICFVLWHLLEAAESCFKAALVY